MTILSNEERSRPRRPYPSKQARFVETNPQLKLYIRIARYTGGNRDPHAMNSDSPGESKIISTRGPQLFGAFFA
ncbi:MAG: hypothetical protein DMG85_19245 [Acidobacteria bacterium]|nr:MAG: hypothetical protein DMG85_19245 [Acidobacteriota bacterium]